MTDYRMTLDEAIKHAEEVAEKNEFLMTSDDGYTDVSMKRCAADHRQLAEWLMEYKDLKAEQNDQKEAKRLLKLAVEDIVWLNEHTVDGDGGCLIETATDIETCLACPLNVKNSHLCGWKHQAEALVLIGEDGDAE